MKKLSSALGILAFFAGVARAESIEDRVRVLEEKMKIKAETEGEAPAPGSPAAGGSNKIDCFFKNGFTMKSQDGSFEGWFGGRAIIHYRQYFAQSERVSKDSFSIREIKIDLRGKIWKDWGFRVEAATTGPNFSIDDGWVSFERFYFLKAKVGQTKAPFSIQQTQSTLFIDMPERCALDRLVPGYELGAMVYGDIVEKVLSYNVMVANGTGRNGVDNNSDKDLFVRAQLRPFATQESPWIKGLHLAFNFNMGQRGLANGVLPYTYSTPSSATPFVANGPNLASTRFDQVRYRTDVEFAWFIKSFWFHAEYLYTRDSYRLPGAESGEGEPGRGGHTNHHAWFATLGFILTGESKTWDRPIVDKPLFGSACGFGQVELVGRYASFRVPGDLFRDGILSKQDSAQKVDEWALCVNWYPNQNVRLSLQYNWINYNGHSIRPIVVAGHRFDHEDVLVVRAQIDF